MIFPKQQHQSGVGNPVSAGAAGRDDRGGVGGVDTAGGHAGGRTQRLRGSGGPRGRHGGDNSNDILQGVVKRVAWPNCNCAQLL